MNKKFINDIFHLFILERPDMINIFNEHITLISVSDIEYTGIGCYITFTYKINPKKIFDISLIGLSKVVYINDIITPFNIYIDIELGKINFIEISTYGDVFWDGTIYKWLFKNIE